MGGAESGNNFISTRTATSPPKNKRTIGLSGHTEYHCKNILLDFNSASGGLLQEIERKRVKGNREQTCSEEHNSRLQLAKRIQ